MKIIKRLLFKPDPLKALEENEHKENVCGAGLQGDKIVFLVTKKEPKESLRKKDILPKDVSGYETEVIEVGEITMSRSGAGLSGSACTIGSIGKIDGENYLLQNAHCARDLDKYIVSPSPIDGGTIKNKVGTITWRSPINTTGFNQIDALVARTGLQMTHSGWEDPKIGEVLESHGRTTGEKQLTVIADNVAISVLTPKGRARYVNQIMLEGTVRGGDSGSAIESNGIIKGLIFASNNQNIGFANKISEVVRATGLSFETTAPTINWEIIFKWEGGYVNDPHDPGGETKYGISKRAYPNENIRNISKERAKEIYIRDYYTPMRCAIMEPRLALFMLDFAINAGVRRATLELQKALGLKADGIIGPITQKAIEKANKKVLTDVMINRLIFYTGLSTFQRFGKGWYNRTIDVYEA